LNYLPRGRLLCALIGFRITEQANEGAKFNNPLPPTCFKNSESRLQNLLRNSDKNGNTQKQVQSQHQSQHQNQPQKSTSKINPKIDFNKSTSIRFPTYNKADLRTLPG